LRVELPRALARHQNLDAGCLLERGDHRPAPLLLRCAVDDEFPLRGGAERRRQRNRSDDSCQPVTRIHSFLLRGFLSSRWVIAPASIAQSARLVAAPQNAGELSLASATPASLSPSPA